MGLPAHNSSDLLEAENTLRLNFFRLDGQTQATLKECWPSLEKQLPAILDQFYKYLAGWSDLKGHLRDEGNIQRLKSAQTSHWRKLFNGPLDDSYFEECQRIGKAHDRIGLTPLWYVGGYSFVMAELYPWAIKNYPKKLEAVLSSISKALLMDMEVSISVYIKSGEVGKLKNEILALAESLNSEIQDTVVNFGKMGASLTQAAQKMKHSAQSVENSSKAVAEATEQVVGSTHTVAAATEQLATSSQEISHQISNAASLAGKAVNESQRAALTIQQLNDAIQKITSVVDLINSIAKQTNLLALNATIEAARAGEAGKGFAVVANEVKNLALQTSSATKDVAQQTTSIQEAAKATVGAIEAIDNIISNISSISTTIAAAVEEQTVATSEISRSSQDAAQNTKNVSDNIQLVLSESQETLVLSENVENFSKDVQEGILVLEERLIQILRTSSAGDRRNSPRKKTNTPGTLRAKGKSLEGHITNISEGGLEFKSSNGDVFPMGTTGDANIQGVSASLPFMVVSSEHQLIHLMFQGDARPHIRHLL